MTKRKTKAFMCLISLMLALSLVFSSETLAFACDLSANGMFYSDYTSMDETVEAAEELNLELAEEGFVLIKNDGILPIDAKTNRTVSVFGVHQANLLGGSGSVGASLENVGFSVNGQLISYYAGQSAEYPQGGFSTQIEKTFDMFNDFAVVVLYRTGGEGTDLSTVTTEKEDNKDGNGEEYDWQHKDLYEDENGTYKHYLQLTESEESLFAYVKSHFDKIVVVLNMSNALEMANLENDDDINAILWIGRPGTTGVEAVGEILVGEINPSGGLSDEWVKDLTADPTWQNFGTNSQHDSTHTNTFFYYDENGELQATGNTGSAMGGEGIMALGKILSGEVNPSGRTVDTWSSDFTLDPTFANFGTGSTPSDSDKYDAGLYYFVDYEEGIYVGYRYYETRGLTDGENWYKQNVVYPFGYGLSYTAFDWGLKGVSSNTITKDGKIKITVEVKNSGSVEGKDVVQLYCVAPYTKGGIEKSAKVLCGFTKTKLLRPGESETVEIEFTPYDVASYDYRDQNGNGFSGYELEKGTYNLYVSKNAHESTDKVELTLAANIRYDSDPVTGNTVGNRYTEENNVTATDLSIVTDSDYQLSVILSRSDWEGTFPTAPTDAERAASARLIAELKDKETNNPNDYSEAEYPYFEEATEKTIKDLLPDEVPSISYKAFVDYDDPLFIELISACTAEELINMYNYAAYKTSELSTINMPMTLHADGPSGWTCFLNKKVIKGTCHYASEPVMSSTWNTVLIEELGNAIGEEGINGGETPYSSIYAPGVNIHRSMFGGRCAEYFSEDPFMTGKMAAAEIRGCQEMGVICTIKHFAVNEQETHRSINGDCSWLTEQSLREIYLKSFEIGIKESESRGIMTSFNRIGTRWTGGDYRLITEILREEWGFKGVVQCDFNTVPQYMNSKQMAYAGGDINLATIPESWCDPSETGDAVILQNSAKNVIYAFVNSNAMKGEVLYYTSPVWTTVMYAVDAILAVGILTWGAITVVKLRKDKE